MTKYNRDSKVFEKIDNEQKAYWLGFIAADGYVNQERKILDIQLQEGDKEHLKKCQRFLKTNSPIKTTNRGDVRLCLYDEKITRDLSFWGLVPGKSKTLAFPKNIPEGLLRHFIRGYFDGDGSIYKHKQKTERGKGIYHSYRIEICGTEPFIRTLWGIIGRMGKVRFHKRVWCLELNKKKDVSEFLSKLYLNSEIYLERKYKKSLEAIIINNQ